MVGPVKSAPRHLELAADRVRRWWPWLLASLLLHLPFTPIGPLVGLLSLLLHLRSDIPDEPVEDLLGIPVELLTDPEVPAPTLAAAAPAEPEGVVVAPPKPKTRKPLDKDAPDAGVPDAGPLLADAGLSDAGVPEAIADAAVADGGLNDAGPLDGGPGDAGAGDAGAPKPDPFAIAGDFPLAPKTNANVKIHLFTSALQNHPAGRAIAALLKSEPQWQDFLGPGGVDPIRDLSRIVIYGPQLADSSKIGVLLEYANDSEAVRLAVDALVKRTEGARWATENKKPVAYVKAADADRVIIFFPGKIIAIVPPGPVQTQLIAAKKAPSLPKGTDDSVVFQGSLRTPHRVKPIRRMGVEIPQSIAEARLFVSTLRNGGATLRLEMVDESAEAAAAHLVDLERQISVLTMGLVSLQWRTEQQAAAKGTEQLIIAEAQLSPGQITAILIFINQQIAKAKGRPRP